MFLLPLQIVFYMVISMAEATAVASANSIGVAGGTTTSILVSYKMFLNKKNLAIIFCVLH